MYKETFKMVNGDLVIEDGDFVLVDDQEELRQNLENRYSINKGEWFLDIELGLDYEAIQGKGVSDGEIELAIRECGLQDDRISQVIDIEVDRYGVDRHADITFKVIDREEEEYKQGVVSDE